MKQVVLNIYGLDCQDDTSSNLGATPWVTIYGLRVKKVTGYTTLNDIEVGDRVDDWENNVRVAYLVTGLPYTDEANRDYSINAPA